MRNCILLPFFLFVSLFCTAQLCRFETSNGKETATYFEAVNWYKNLDKASSAVSVKEMGMTDAGYPLHLVLVSTDGKSDPAQWHKQNKAVILINNGIHPGEPDGIDASMMLVRDIVTKKVILPPNVVLAFIPVYNIGGCLNRGTSSRANQNGPAEYGFRGNSQNLDLNRDFTKCDTKEAKAFAQIYHFLDPDIFVDNHVSDGADYQHTMTLLTTQYDKLGAGLGRWLKETFEPQLYNGMKEKNWDMVPYVNFEEADFNKGMQMFYDPPRYSSGYTTLFQTIGFVPETHMLKPFKDRVLSTYALMKTIIEKAAIYAVELIKQRNLAKQEMISMKSCPLSWAVDTFKYDMITFKGYEQAFKPSDATGLQRMFYDYKKPYTRQLKFYNTFTPSNFVNVPRGYVIPQGWSSVIDILKLNGVSLLRLAQDTLQEVETYRIDDYKSLSRPYEKHHKNYAVKVTLSKQKVHLYKGDYVVLIGDFPIVENTKTDFYSRNFPATRYLIEMLEPTGDDSFFAWNFFDGILQQKEGYSDYRWDDVAAEVLKNNPGLQQKLEEQKKADAKFAASASAQLEFIYKNSSFYEPGHNRYPVYRLL